MHVIDLNLSLYDRYVGRHPSRELFALFGMKARKRKPKVAHRARHGGETANIGILLRSPFLVGEYSSLTARCKSFLEALELLGGGSKAAQLQVAGLTLRISEPGAENLCW